MADDKKDLSIELQIEGLQKVSSDLRSMVSELNSVARAINPVSAGITKAFGDKDLKNLNQFTAGLGRLDKILDSVGEKADRMGARVSRALGSIQGAPGGENLFNRAGNKPPPGGKQETEGGFFKGATQIMGNFGMGSQTGSMMQGLLSGAEKGGVAGPIAVAVAAAVGAIINAPQLSYNLDKSSRENSRYLNYAGLTDPGQATAGALGFNSRPAGAFERGAERTKEDLLDVVRNPLFLFDNPVESDTRRQAAADRRIAERRMEEQQELGTAFNRVAARAAARSPLERLYGTAGVSNVLGHRSPYSVDTLQAYGNIFESAGATGSQFNNLQDFVAGSRGYGVSNFLETGLRRGTEGPLSTAQVSSALGGAGLGVNGASYYENYRAAGDVASNFINGNGFMPGIQGQSDILGKAGGLISAAGDLMPGSSASAQGQIAGMAMNQNTSALNSSPIMEAQMSQLSSLGITNVIDQGEILAYLKSGRETEAANLIKSKARGVITPGDIDGIIKAPQDYSTAMAGMFGRSVGQVTTALSGNVEAGIAATARMGESGSREMRFTETGGVELARDFKGGQAKAAPATAGDQLEAARASEGRAVEKLIQDAGATMAAVISDAAQVWVNKVFEQSIATKLIGQNARPPGSPAPTLRPSGAKR